MLQKKDAVRTAELAHRGYRVIRFWNNDVMENLAGLLETIPTPIGCPVTARFPLRP
ncbi:MAG TPA: DUF559 domain-containing protein [Stellaceae bacterium]